MFPVLCVVRDVPQASVLTALSAVYTGEVRDGKLGTGPGDAGILLPPPSSLLSPLSLENENN